MYTHSNDAWVVLSFISLSISPLSSAVVVSCSYKISSDLSSIPGSNSWKGKLCFLFCTFSVQTSSLSFRNLTPIYTALLKLPYWRQQVLSNFQIWHPYSLLICLELSGIFCIAFLGCFYSSVSLFFLYPLMTTFLSPSPIYESYNAKPYICKLYQYYICIYACTQSINTSYLIKYITLRGFIWG